jgi:hypothetical protein
MQKEAECPDERTTDRRGPRAVTESPNPNEGRPAGSRSYGDSASTAVRQAATATQFGGAPYASGQNPTVAPPAPQAQAPGPGGPAGPGGPQQTGAPATGGARPAAVAAESMSRALSGAGRSFARVGAAIGSAAQNQQARQGGAPGSPSQARVRKARLRVARVDPWSVMKVSFVLSIAMGIVTIVGTAVVWNVLNALGVFDSLNKTVGDLTSSGSGTTTSSFSVSSFLSFGHVESYMLIVALVDVVLVTALATLGAYLYNLASGFVGGFEVTLAEDQ